MSRARASWLVVVVLGVALLTLALRPAGAPPGTAVDTRAVAGTSLVLVVVDTLRADHVGAWGYPRPTTPRLDALAARGVRVTRLITTASWTRPAMASLFTGEYARTVGVYEERFDVLPDDALTLAERLDGAGYLTLGLTANPNINALFRFDQGFDDWVDSDVVFRFMPTGAGHRRFAPRRAALLDAAEMTDRALGLVDTHRAALERAPYLLFVLYIDPHYPYAPPPEHLAAIAGSGAGAGEDEVDRYDGEVHYADAEIGRLVDGLRARALLDDALIVVTSDHGEGLRDHPGLPLGGTHGHHLYDSVLEVPLILNHPDLPAGAEVTELASMIDVQPTLLDLLGLSAASGPGRSLAPSVREEGAVDPPDHVFAETAWRYVDKIAVRTASHLHVRSDMVAAWQADGAHEQRRLRSPERAMLERMRPEETHRVGRGAQVPGDSLPARPGLVRALAAWDAATPRRPPEGRSPRDVLVTRDGEVVPVVGGEELTLDPSIAAQLEALGYAE